MSGDEIFALIVSLVIGLIGWTRWFGGLLLQKTFNRRTGGLFSAVLSPVIAVAIVLFVLCRWSSHDVRDNIVYVLFYLAMWFGWTGALNLFLPYLGLSSRDDMIERQNPAAGLAIAGALIGCTLAFAGGNIGDGPGWWVVVFSASLATGTLTLLWVVGNSISHIEEAVTIDRDVASGWRTLGFFVGGGLIVGRAAAGNWHSAGATIFDFIDKGWLVLLLWGVVVLMDVAFRPSPTSPVRNSLLFGLIPALLLVVSGLLAALIQGAW